MTLEDAKKSLQRYAQNHIPPGDFLSAVLTNNLYKTIRCADPESLEILPAIFNHVWNELPANIYGSPATVKAHIEKGIGQEEKMG